MTGANPGGIPGSAEVTADLSADADSENVTSIQFTSESSCTPKAVLHPNELRHDDA